MFLIRITNRLASVLFIIVIHLLLSLITQPNCPIRSAQAAPLGHWKLLLNNTGISAMHMQLLPNNRVIMFDRTDFGLSNISLPDGTCRDDRSDLVLKTDCTAHSVEYDVSTNSLRPLTILTDTWCSSGALMPDGCLVQTGGYNDGECRTRIFAPCDDRSCDWTEMENILSARRWYATNQLLPDGTQIIIGGSEQFNYEYYPKTSVSGLFDLPFLSQTRDEVIDNNLYPFVFLNTDGNLFIFANNRAILFDHKSSTLVRTYPSVPGDDPRNYPSSGSAVLLPLKSLTSASVVTEVLVCGGAPRGSYTKATNDIFVEALSSCARMNIIDPNPEWEMETMPFARVMGDMTLLPNGDVLIINGAGSGAAGWELGRNPILSPVRYRPENPTGLRFEVQNPTTIPRLYHSTSILLPDGRVLVGGSNPHVYYNFTGVLFPTELRLEAFHPSYMDSSFDPLRPRIMSPGPTATVVGYGTPLAVEFHVAGELDPVAVTVAMVSPPFNTHAFSMNQRMLELPIRRGAYNVTRNVYGVQVLTPMSPVLAPPGFFMVFVVHRKVPSPSIWVQIK